MPSYLSIILLTKWMCCHFNIKITNIVISQLNDKQEYLMNDINKLNEKYEIINKKNEKSIYELNKWNYFFVMIIGFLLFKIIF